MREATKTKIRAVLRRLARKAAQSKKAIAGLIGPSVVILGIPLSQLQLPSEGDWKRAAGAAIGAAIAVYVAPKNAD